MSRVVSRAQRDSNRSHRVIASLNREQVDFLDKIGKDAWFSSGVKLSRTQILAAMVNVLRRLNPTGEGVQSSNQFEQRIVEAIAKLQRNHPAASSHMRASHREGMM